MPSPLPALVLALLPHGWQEQAPLAAAIRASDIEAHVRVLASDELQGRRSGTPELRKVAEYIAGALAAAGVQPAGDAGTYFQEIPLAAFEHQGPPRLAVGGPAGTIREARAAAEFEVSIQGEPRSTGVLDSTLARSAAEIPTEPRADQALLLDATTGQARDWLRERGAEDGRGWGLLVVPGMDQEREREPKAPRSQGLRPVDSKGDRPDWVTVHGELKRALFAGDAASVELEYRHTVERMSEPNVLARIPSVTQPPADEEAIVLSAHMDHLGMRPPGTNGAGPDEDLVYNGADDDASGVAVLLELAAALVAEEPPERTLVFLFATGEEVGLWGTYHYLDHPVVPLGSTVLNLNFEMLGRPDPLVGGAGILWLTGFERSNLGSALREKELAILPDARLEEHFFERSDNIAFVKRGIVGQTLSTYNMHTDYHGPDDEADRLDYLHMESCAKAALEAVRITARADFVPRWAEGEPDLRRR